MIDEMYGFIIGCTIMNAIIFIINMFILWRNDEFMKLVIKRISEIK
jgi:hypothetical protein